MGEMRKRGRYSDVITALVLSLVVMLGGAAGFSLIEAPSSEGGKLQVTATFYPLYFFASQIGGDRANVLQLMSDNAEPHSWEPKPSDLIKVDRSKVFVYNGAGFEPWAESFIASLAHRSSIQIVDTSVGIVNESNSHLDPHFWLDPISAEKQVDNILAGFIKADNASAAYYTANANALKANLTKLDNDFRVGLQNRTKNDFITTHEGFDYLAARYGLTPHAAVGISADQLPSPAAMVNLTNLVRSLGLHYVFSEPIFSDTVVQTIATETGAQVLILDGIHGRVGVDAGLSYFQIMYQDLKELRIGLEVTS